MQTWEYKGIHLVQREYSNFPREITKHAQWLRSVEPATWWIRGTLHILVDLNRKSVEACMEDKALIKILPESDLEALL